jgi:RNA polymerase sigma-70 factor (ECF subfamily)
MWIYFNPRDHESIFETRVRGWRTKERAMNESVLARVARGDAKAVRECIDEFGGLVWAIARRMTRSRADAEDAVQEIFIDVWRSAGRFDAAQGSEKVFITTIARRRLIDRIRRGKMNQMMDPVDSLEDAKWAEPGNDGEVRVEAERAAAVVARLRPDQRKVLSMGLLEGMTHSEIATATGMPLGTVKTQMRRGLIQVRQWMKIENPVRIGEATP